MVPVPSSLIQELVTVMRRGDLERFRRTLGHVASAARGLDADDLTATIAGLAPLLPALGGVFAKVAVFLGACVEWGGSPFPLRDVLPARAALAMEDVARFPAAWEQASDGRPLPDRDVPPPMSDVHDVLVAAADRCGVSESTASRLAFSWYDVDDWLKPMITLMQERDFRAVMQHRDRVRTASAAIADSVERAHWVHGLLCVLDDEPLVVLDPASERGFHLTMSGIGDNYQLHTLLADRLIGEQQHGLLAGERPEPAWVAAATDGFVHLPATDPIYRRFRLFDGHGNYIYPEGRPYDIEPVDGVRVIVLHPPLGRFGWLEGRVYEQMVPTLTLDSLMEPAVAARWIARIAPPREDDFMATSRA